MGWGDAVTIPVSYPNGFYQGAVVSKTFMNRWRSMDHTGAARPYCEVWVRRGRLKRSWHNNWPSPQFGRVWGHAITHQWYPDWTPLDNWTQLEGVYEVDLDQSFDNNGIATASITADNVQWVQKNGPAGKVYHQRQRGYLWPWYGYVPPTRPGGAAANQNQWYMRLPNAQILVRQGYGSDTAVKTFTGLIDTLDATLRPDRLVIAARDFGSVLTDSHLFGWNMAPDMLDPVTFIPPDYIEKFSQAEQRSAKQNHRWVVVNDVADIVRVCLRWAGFKEWQVEDSGVNLYVPVTYDKSHTLMDVINEIATALGFVFFMGEPTDGPVQGGAANDLSIGVPVFRRPTAFIAERSLPIMLSSNQLLTDIKPKHDNTNERGIIRVRGQLNKKVGRTLYGDTFKRVTFNYWPPGSIRQSGVDKQLTWYDIGKSGVIGLQTIQQCMVACILIALQILLSRDTAVAQCPGQPAFGLDSMAFIADVTGVNSRLYITNRKSTMTLGGDGSSQQKSPYGTSGSSQNELLWATEIGGSLPDNPDFERTLKDYHKALSGGSVYSWGPE